MSINGSPWCPLRRWLGQRSVEEDWPRACNEVGSAPSVTPLRHRVVDRLLGQGNASMGEGSQGESRDNTNWSFLPLYWDLPPAHLLRRLS